MRYFLEFAYNGTRFCGYQEQPHSPSIQEHIEKALSMLLRVPTKIVGCGRTDAGVHALQYFAHFDGDVIDEQHLLFKLNSVIGKDIVFYAIHEAGDDAHARFDASSRSYEYIVRLQRDPFRQEAAYFCPFGQHLDHEKLQAAAKLLLDYSDFTTFCKTNTDVHTKLCDLRQSEWTFDPIQQELKYEVTANRFLRGMIRLIVGMCLNVAKGKVELEVVKAAMENKQPLKQAWSAPAQGLFLKDIKYPFL